MFPSIIKYKISLKQVKFDKIKYLLLQRFRVMAFLFDSWSFSNLFQSIVREDFPQITLGQGDGVTPGFNVDFSSVNHCCRVRLSATASTSTKIKCAIAIVHMMLLHLTMIKK